MLSILGEYACVLLDPGATHSFISTMFTTGIDKNLELLPSELLIATPIGKTLVANNVYRNCVV